MKQCCLPACPPACLLACLATASCRLFEFFCPAIEGELAQWQSFDTEATYQWLQAAMFNAAAKPRKKRNWTSICSASATCNQNSSSSSERVKCLYRKEAAWAVDASGDGRCDVTGLKWLDVMRPKSTPLARNCSACCQHDCAVSDSRIQERDEWTWTWTRWDWSDEPKEMAEMSQLLSRWTTYGRRWPKAEACIGSRHRRLIGSNLEQTGGKQRSHAEPGSPPLEPLEAGLQIDDGAQAGLVQHLRQR
ncbi:hypothetical protein BBK36DRAFT_1197722 [Trichoderma citrinoviride]|uniref:Uncharacterized protein n=1 Tax=Trichoderma citrinoviride TaxID=58853 RepID=A0A2T4BEH1_9HYPO|nr:hypothetical protein BBK36DRAFT_1197722 [Trichoderma citrinoviride]PTB67732.1 hypothetical protein BBK36DRAFT_1197722 [Trichoderma citrinoviride]